METLIAPDFKSSLSSKIVKRAIQTLALCGLLFIGQGCAHYVAEVPVAPVVVRPAPPYAGAVWIDGGWAWRGGRHTYVNGYWGRSRPGRMYQAGEWRHGPRGHYYVRGRWR